MCICQVSPEPSLLIYTQAIDGGQIFRSSLAHMQVKRMSYVPKSHELSKIYFAGTTYEYTQPCVRSEIRRTITILVLICSDHMC